MAYKCNVDRIRVDLGESHIELRRGDACDQVPEGSLEPMLRLGQIVDAEEYLEDASEEAGDVETPPAESWGDTPVTELSVSGNAEKALLEKGLGTARAVVEYAAANDGLQSIDGIGAASEKEITAAIARISQ